MSTYQTEAEIMAVLRGLESCETDKSAFKHQDHLTVAVCYLQDLSVEEAVGTMHDALLRFLDHHKVDRQKYNETITVFWFEVIAQQLQSLPPNSSLVEKCNAVIETFNGVELIYEYYSTEVLFSVRARSEFVGPDLRDWRRT